MSIEMTECRAGDASEAKRAGVKGAASCLAACNSGARKTPVRRRYQRFPEKEESGHH